MDQSKKFPKESALKKFRDRLSDPQYTGGNLALPKNASKVDRAKYQLCQLIAKHKQEKNLLSKDIAQELGVDEARISEILRGRIESFTLDRLITYADRLMPGINVVITDEAA